MNAATPPDFWALAMMCSRDNRHGKEPWRIGPTYGPTITHAVRRVACLLLRPESLLSDELARDWLRVALAFAAA